MNSIFFQILSLIYMLLLIILFFSKKRIHTIENKLFKILMISNLTGLLLDIITYFVALNNTLELIAMVLCRFILIYYLTWIILFTLYIYVISFGITYNNFDNKKYSIIKKLLFIVYCISFVLSWVLPLSFIGEKGATYSYGLAVNYCYTISGICIISWIIWMLMNIRHVSAKKYYPLFAFIVIGIIVVIIQYYNPMLLLMSAMQSFVTFLMYFTIENPDMKLIEQLNIERDRADKANNAKSEFLSNMSHEIRTPLNAIVGFSNSLADEDLTPDARDQLKDIIMASDNLIELVNGILDISKIEANKLEIIDVDYSLRKIFDELCSLTKARMGDKGLEFRIYYDESIPPVLYGDQIRLKQIILNLLTNAVKYTKEGYIEFKVSGVIKEDVCRLIISIEDSGIGIKKESIDKLFTKFERLGVERESTIEGTGLGLAITKKLVELMSGRILVQSEYGKGSKFTVAIDQKIVKGKQLEDLSKTQKIDIASIHAQDKKVLIVDDNTLNLKVAERLLKKYNLEVICANSGDECLNKINSGEHFDLILLDDMMPKLSGIETLKLLKSKEGFSIPVVALTANAISGMKEKYLAEGFDDYLAKPIELPELNRVVKKYLG